MSTGIGTTLESAVKELLFILSQDYGLVYSEGPAAGCDDAGTFYTTLTLQGIKHEGQDDNVYVASPSMALKIYSEQLIKWLDGRQVIVWRTKPEIITVANIQVHQHYTLKLYQVDSSLTAYHRSP